VEAVLKDGVKDAMNRFNGLPPVGSKTEGAAAATDATSRR